MAEFVGLARGRRIGFCEDYSHKLVFVILPWAMRTFHRHLIIYDLHSRAVLRSSDPRAELTCPDTSAPAVYFPWHTPDRWLRQLQQKIDTEIQEAEARARDQMAVITDPARHTHISPITAPSRDQGLITPPTPRCGVKANPRRCFFDQ